MRYKLLFLVFLWLPNIYSQRYVDVIDETIIVNSVTALSGYTRNITEVTLPEHTVSYVYRVTITSKNISDRSTPLLSLLSNSPNIVTAGISRMSEYAIKNNDNHAVDAFIFNNVYDATDFYQKKDGVWTYCKAMPNRTNCCFESSECINRKIFFGFRNNNISEGLNVRLEVIALIDDVADNKSSYTISNSTNTELKYFVSADNVNWEENTLRSGYNKLYNNSLKELYFKIYTNNDFVHYRIFPNERYKLIMNTEKSIWDLIKY